MTTETFYDELAPFYRLLYPDWEASARRQAAALDGVIREFFGAGARSVLDAACGIGTQCIGLADMGYAVAASDISPLEVEAAWREATARGLDVELRVADMRSLWAAFGREFDVVMACDNAIPHLLSVADILQAFRQFHRCAAPGGGCIITVRDYAVLDRGMHGERLYPRLSHRTAAGRTVIFDHWQFDGDYYDLTTYVVEDKGGSAAETHVMRGGRYYCVTIEVLEGLLRQAGFQQVQTLRERFFQPLIVGRKGS